MLLPSLPAAVAHPTSAAAPPLLLLLLLPQHQALSNKSLVV